MRRFWVIISLLSVWLTGFAGATDQPLSDISEIRSLSMAEANQALPVELESQVVWVDPIRKAVFIYDGEKGIYVRRKRPYEPDFVVHPGDLIKVIGVTSAGGFSNAIFAADIVVTGHAPLPPAVPYRDNLLQSPLVDCEWMSVSGRIVSATTIPVENYIHIELRRNNFVLDVQLPYTPESEQELQSLLFGWVELNAVAGTVYNDQRQATGRIFYANSAADFRRTNPMELIQSAGPTLAIEELMQRDRPHNWLVNTSGTVTSVGENEVFLRGDTVSLKVSLSRGQAVEPGDFIKIDGVITPGPVSPSFNARNVTVLRSGPPPEPTPLLAGEAIDTHRNYDLVEIEAVLVDIGQSFESPGFEIDASKQSRLLCRADNRSFEARLPVGAELDPTLRVGSMLRLTGICYVNRRTELRWRLEVDDFWIQLRDGADIEIIAAASWWTAARLMWVIGIAIVVLALFSIWVLLLRKTVDRQTAIIGEKVEHETILNERQRMARELHDNLDQGLTGAAIQLQASRKFLEKSGATQVESVGGLIEQVDDVALKDALAAHMSALQEDSAKSQSVLKSVQAMLSHCGEESRTSILDLRGGLLERMDLPSALSESFQQLAEECGAEAAVEVLGVPRRLKLKAERNLLMVAREAAANAARHAQPKRLEVTLEFEDDRLEMRVHDDGCGFAMKQWHKAGHFGLRGMQERINRLNGSIEIDSELGKGTKICISLMTKEWELDQV